MSGSRDLFKRIKAGGRAIFDQMLSDRWIENPILDFKRVANDAAPMIPESVKTYAEALSGFANSEGGVIVWGVDCRKGGQDEADCVSALNPISGLKRFEGDLQQYASSCVSPGVSGIEHFCIEDVSGSDKGFAVTFVPKGEGEPHMARAKNQHRFYYRSGFSFLIMEPWMLADRYGRRPQPKLDFIWRIENGGSESGPGYNNLIFRLIIGIANCGKGIARFPGLGIREHDLFKIHDSGLDGMRRFGLPERPQSPNRRYVEKYRFFGGGADDVIHPGTTLDVVSSEYKIQPNSQGHPDMVLDYELHCEGFSYEESVLIPGAAFLKFRDDQLSLNLKPPSKPEKDLSKLFDKGNLPNSDHEKA